MAQVGPYEPLEPNDWTNQMMRQPELPDRDSAVSFDDRQTQEIAPTPSAQSQVFFACYGVLIFVMIGSCICVFSLEGLDAPCDRPLALWTVVHVVRHGLKGTLFGFKQLARDRNLTSISKLLVWAIKTVEVFGIIWWFKGAHWLYKLEHCSQLIYILMAVFFSIQTLFLLIPCVVLILIIACLPIVIWILPIFVPQNPNQQATSEETIEKISKFAWNTVRNLEHLGFTSSDDSEEVRLVRTCSICLTQFEDGQEVMEMPCDKRHLFHSDCVGQWLRTSQNCPLCRTNIPQRINTDEQRSQP